MWLFNDVVILMNFFEPCIVKYLSYTLIWRKSLVESCWKGAHSFNSVIEVFALAIATGFRAFDSWFGQSICKCYFDQSSCNSVIFSPHKINFGILATLIANRIFMKHFSGDMVVWNIWSFLGKKRQNIFLGFFLLIERALFCRNLFVWLGLLLDYFQLNTQYKIPRTNQTDILNTFIQLLLPRIPMVWE